MSAVNNLWDYRLIFRDNASTFTKICISLCLFVKKEMFLLSTYFFYLNSTLFLGSMICSIYIYIHMTSQFRSNIATISCDLIIYLWNLEGFSILQQFLMVFVCYYLNSKRKLETNVKQLLGRRRQRFWCIYIFQSSSIYQSVHRSS